MNAVEVGDCRVTLAGWAREGVRVQSVVTSPPYWGLRDYGVAGQLGLEATPELYVAHLVEVFRLVRDVLADDGTLWLVVGDSYAGGGGFSPGSPANLKRANGDAEAWGAFHPAKMERMSARKGTGVVSGLKPKDLVGIPWRVAFALQADGWWLRSEIIWAKPNPMPESVVDRPTKAHETVFLLSKRERYYYDAAAIAEPAIHAGRVVEYDGTQKNCTAGDAVNDMRTRIDRTVTVSTLRNRRSVWTIATAPYDGAHFAVFPPDLVKPCILAGSRPGDVILDPFMGAGTVAMVAQDLGRRWLGCELSEEYAALCERRTRQQGLVLEAW